MDDLEEKWPITADRSIPRLWRERAKYAWIKDWALKLRDDPRYTEPALLLPIPKDRAGEGETPRAQYQTSKKRKRVRIRLLSCTSLMVSWLHYHVDDGAMNEDLVESVDSRADFLFLFDTLSLCEGDEKRSSQFETDQPRQK